MTENGNFTIYKAGRAEISSLAAIGAATFLESFADILDGDAIMTHCKAEHSEERYAAYFDKGSDAWIAAAGVGGAPIGYALTAQPDLPGTKIYDSDRELKRIYTFSRFHGSGLGLALLEKAIAHCPAATTRLLLGVYEGNIRAIRFYEKHGFQSIGTREFQVGHKIYHDLVLAKDLHRNAEIKSSPKP